MLDFQDRRTFMVRPGSTHLGCFWSDAACGHEQRFNGPVLLVVGMRASNEDCAKLAASFDLPVDDVITFRDSGLMQ